MPDSDPVFPGPRALGKRGPAHAPACPHLWGPRGLTLAGVFSLDEVLEDFNILQFKMSKFRVENGCG